MTIAAGALLASQALLGQLVGPEFRVNLPTSAGLSSSVAADGSGNFVVVWSSGSGIVGRRVDPVGVPLGDEFAISVSTTLIHDLRPRVAAKNDGGFLVAWQTEDPAAPPTAQWGITTRAFDSAGDPLGGEVELANGGSRLPESPEVSAMGTGGFVVVWNGFGGYDVWARRLDGSGQPQGTAFVVNEAVDLNVYPAVDSGPEGDFVVVWSRFSGPPDDARAVVGRRFDAQGDPVGEEIEVTSTTVWSPERADVALDASGRFLAVWNETTGRDGSETGAFGRVVDETNLPVGDDFQVNTYSSGGQLLPRAAADGAGGFMVAWIGAEPGGSGVGVFAQHLDAVGGRVGSEFRVNTYTTGDQAGHSVAGDGTGGFLVTWRSAEQDDGVLAQRVRIGVFADGFESGDVCGWSATSGGGSCP